MLALTESTAQRLERALADICTVLLGDETATNPPGFIGGRAGHLLCAWQLHRHDSSLVDESRFSHALESLQGDSQALMNAPTFSYGISGVAWLFEYLLAEQDDAYSPAFNRGVDRVLSRCLDIPRWRGEIEFIKGISGIAAYAARRRRNVEGSDVYCKIVSHLEQLAEWRDDGLCTWATPKGSVFRMGSDPSAREYNLGLAHGMPAVLAALIPGLAFPETRESATSLVSAGCRWLLLQAQDAEEYGSHFPYVADKPGHSRLGWCYGDAAIALTIARAGAALADAELIDAARRIALHAANRNSKTGLVRDAGLCHGSAGLYLIFRLLYAQLGDSELLHAADNWLQETLSRHEADGLHGFDAYRNDAETGKSYYRATHDALSGYASVGLCLAVAAGKPADWVDAYLMG